MIKAIDGHEIQYIEEEINTNNVVLLCHGITSSKEEGGFFNRFSDELCATGVSTFRFDFRGHGESNISPEEATIAGMIADLNCVIEYLKKKYQSISVINASFGASIFLLLLQEVDYDFNGVILLNPVVDYKSTFTDSITDWSKSFFPIGGLRNMLSFKDNIYIGDSFVLNKVMGLELFYYCPNKIAWHYKIPAIIFHGTKDNIVSIEDSKKFTSESNPKFIKLVELTNTTHGLEEKTNEVIKYSCEFIKKLT